MNKLLIWTLLFFYVSFTLVAQDTSTGQSLLDKGTAAQASEFRDSAVYYFKKAQNFYREKANWQKYIEASAGLCRNYMRLDEYGLVEENAMSAFDIHDKYNLPENDINYLELLNQMGRINWWIKGDFAKAFEYLHRAKHLAASLDEPDKMLRPVYTDLGYTHAYEGNFDSAVYYYRKALDMSIELQGAESAQTADRYTDLAIAYIQKSAWEKAEIVQKKAIELNIETRGEDHIATLKCYNNLGFIYLEKHDNDQAIFYLNKGIDLIKKKFGPSHRSVGIGYMNLGAAYHNKGDDINSVKYSRMARENYKTSLGEQSPFMAIVLVNLGTGYSELNQVDSALYYFNAGLELNRKLYGEDHQEMVSYYAYMNDFYITHEMYKEAEEGIKTSIDVANRVMPKKHLFTARNYYQMAEVMAATDRLDEALEQCQKSLTRVMLDFEDMDFGANPSVSGETVSRRKLLEILTLKTHLLLDKYRLTDAPELLQYASETATFTDKTIDLLRAEYQTPESKEVLLTRSKRFYEDAVNIAFLQYNQDNDQSYLDDAFAYMEKSKSVLLYERIQSRTESLEAVLPDSLANEEKSLARNIANYEEQLFNARASNDTTGLALLKTKLFETKRAYDFLFDRIKIEYPDYYEIRYQTFDTSIDEIQKSLAENTLLINYFMGEKDVYILALNRKEVIHSVVANRQQLTNQVNQLLSSVKNKAYSALLANEIYNAILLPILNQSKQQINMLAIVPDDILHYLPFEILQTSGNDRRAYLLQDFTIRYLHSASVPERSERKNTNQLSYLGFSPGYSKESNPLLASRSAENNRIATELMKLPMAAEEIRASAKIWNGQYFIDSDATESAFKQNAADVGIIHIASHAIIDDEEPMNSRLVFTSKADSTEDGLLHTYELYNLSLTAELACLSACNTGFGKVKSGEGMVSLAKGFYYAGVPNIMMSLWSVPDNSTSEIIQMFNEELEKGAGKADALRMAKLRYLEQADAYGSEPYHWAAFTLIGDNDSISTNEFSAWYFVGIVLLGAAGLFIYSRKKT